MSLSLSSGPSVEVGELGDRRVAHGEGKRDCDRAREGGGNWAIEGAWGGGGGEGRGKTQVKRFRPTRDSWLPPISGALLYP